MLAALLLLSLRRRSRWITVLSVVGAVMTRSPTVMLTLAVAVPGYYLIVTSWRSTKILILLTVATLIPTSMVYLQTRNTEADLQSSNSIVNTIGRLMSGVDYIRTGGEIGENERAKSTYIVFQELDNTGWRNTGGGIGASDVYFHAKYPPPTAAQSSLQPNSILLWTWVNWGIVGVVLLVAALAMTVLRLRRQPNAAAVFLPFIVASLINSAEGIQLYKFVFLAIVAVGLGFRSSIAVRSTKAPGRSVSRTPVASI